MELQKKILLLSCLTVAIQLCTYAQEHEVIKGANYKMSVKKGWADIEPIGHQASNAYYILHPFSKVYGGAYVGSKDAYIGKVNQEVNMETFEKLELTYEGKELQLEFGLELNNTSYVFSSFQNNALKKSFLFAQSVNRETLKPDGELVKVAEIDYSGQSKYKNTSYGYRLSHDRSRLLLVHNLLDKDGSLLSIGFTVTDDKLKTLGTLTDISLAGDGIYNFQEFYVSKSGDVYLLVKFFDEKKEYKNNVQLKKQGLLSSTRSHETEPNYSYKIMEFKKFSPTPQVMNVALDGLFVTSLDLIPKDDGGVMAIGFYSGDGDAIPDGVYTQNIDKSMKKVMATDKRSLEGKFAQPSKYVNNTYETSGLLGKRDDLTNFRFTLKDIVKKQSGGYVLAAERNTTLTKTQNSGRTITTYNVYHTDDIAVVDVSASGKINWVEKIEKAQETASLSTLYASFDIREFNDHLLFFFTDFSAQNMKSFGKVVDTESTIVRVDPGGKQTRKVLFNAADDAITIKAANTYEIGKGSYMVYGHNGQALVGFCLVKVH